MNNKITENGTSAHNSSAANCYADDFIQCSAYNDNLADYFLGCKRTPERCTAKAKWVVQVNPPTKDNDGKAYLCDFCHRWHYKFFDHKPLKSA